MTLAPLDENVYNYKELVAALVDSGMNPKVANIAASSLLKKGEDQLKLNEQAIKAIATRYDELSWDTVEYIKAIMVPENAANFDLETLCESMGLRADIVRRERVLPAYKRMVSEISSLSITELSSRFKNLFFMKNIKFLSEDPQEYIKVVCGSMPKEVLVNMILDISMGGVGSNEDGDDSATGTFVDSDVSETESDPAKGLPTHED